MTQLCVIAVDVMLVSDTDSDNKAVANPSSSFVM